MVSRMPQLAPRIAARSFAETWDWHCSKLVNCDVTTTMNMPRRPPDLQKLDQASEFSSAARLTCKDASQPNAWHCASKCKTLSCSRPDEMHLPCSMMQCRMVGNALVQVQRIPLVVALILPSRLQEPANLSVHFASLSMLKTIAACRKTCYMMETTFHPIWMAPTTL